MKEFNKKKNHRYSTILVILSNESKKNKKQYFPFIFSNSPIYPSQLMYKNSFSFPIQSVSHIASL